MKLIFIFTCDKYNHQPTKNGPKFTPLSHPCIYLDSNMIIIKCMNNKKYRVITRNNH